MIRLYKLSWLLCAAVLAFSCSDDDDPLPLPTVDFVVDPAQVEVGIPVMFDNITRNADNYSWSFGGTITSTEVSPTITFTTPGSVEVVLTAITLDGQEVSITKTITVKQRFLTGYSVNVFPAKNADLDWDDGAAPEDVFPDIFVQFLVDKDNPSQAEFDNALFDGIFTNIPVSSFARTDADQGFPTDIILTNEDWGFALFDFDGSDPANPGPTDFEFMAGVIFNPVQTITFKSPAGDVGFISVFITDSAGNTLDVDISFELR